MKNLIIMIVALLCATTNFAKNIKQLPITVENNVKGAPITMGIPFPLGELYSVDNIRLLNNQGKEIPIQTTEVTTWLPADESVKWIWVFFFSEESANYTLEYGEGILPSRVSNGIISTNNMRPQGGITVNTGPLKFSINKQGNGFLDKVYLDQNDDGIFDANEIIASAPDKRRGTFLDILDDNGLDMSKAVIHEVFREKGSGPLHTIFRIEGTYVYENANNPSPFEIRVHAYAGKSFIRVLHTITYTGNPDKHKNREGDHANIATQNNIILSEETMNDPGWTQPDDQIAGSGITFNYHLANDVKFITSTHEGDWYNKASSSLFTLDDPGNQKVGVLQTGPKQNNPEKTSSPTKRIEGFKSEIYRGGQSLKDTQRSNGWVDISDFSKGISLGIKNFFQEYPKEIQVDLKTNSLNGYIWPPEVEPMNFARKHTEKDGGMLGNFAQGITKTTEFIYYFHQGSDAEEIEAIMDYSLNSPVAHAAPEWYAESKVYGNMAAYSSAHQEFENALQYKYDWWSFNQDWEPWYGMFDYGDGKNYYIAGEWHQWNNNEPTVDFQFWTNFMRTGNPKYYYLAEAMSNHTMDVDNVHWPRKRTYLGQINDAIDFWNYEDEPESTPYLGIGRRHAEEHWYSLLSAHVWIQGWIASYYLSGNHRALDVAKMTGDTYLKRIWGDHDLRGRRLYLSVLNLVELFDATKSMKYGTELDKRVETMLELQKEQGGNILIDRYGYSQTYVAQGLYKYYQLTGDTRIKKVLVDHARWVLNVPPYNHEMESYLATIHPLLLGYEFSGNKIYLEEALERAEVLKVSKLSKNSSEFENQKVYSEALLEISNLPESQENPRFTNWEMNQGLRVFGWTHAFNIPYLLYWLEKENLKTGDNVENTETNNYNGAN
ncbi:hypothetical protein FHG64_09675 [Antarcticibacterium flavum]|uniref:Uncharacterized protein n=1 Tax=Antarcticibacterium flavum TaxID=2058175 RepID=A0A5B7X2C5_9FLAO|nr:MULTISPECIES: hypothetical protein [Antarcticibacterium]MCM4160089.1 hypothetical protein [Antarcticibacterium sp. W02-3]QCY69646.1 hypothetical protein FHG64_09675 [Antarcticibacterium flavum]